MDQTRVLRDLKRFSIDNKYHYKGRLAIPNGSQPANMQVRFPLSEYPENAVTVAVAIVLFLIVVVIIVVVVDVYDEAHSFLLAAVVIYRAINQVNCKHNDKNTARH